MSQGSDIVIGVDLEMCVCVCVCVCLCVCVCVCVCMCGYLLQKHQSFRTQSWSNTQDLAAVIFSD